MYLEDEHENSVRKKRYRSGFWDGVWSMPASSGLGGTSRTWAHGQYQFRLFSIRESHGAMRVNVAACTKLALPDRFSVHLMIPVRLSALLCCSTEVRCDALSPCLGSHSFIHGPATHSTSVYRSMWREGEKVHVFSRAAQFSPAVFHK